MLALVLSVIVIVVLAVQLVRQNYVLKEGEKKIPPSLFRLPILGNLHKLRFPVHKTFLEFSRKLGPIMTVWFGQQPMYVVSDITLAKELLVKQHLSLVDRPHRYIGGLYSNGFKGIILANYGNKFREMSLMVHSAIRSFLTANSSFEKIITKEFESMQKSLESLTKSQAIDIRDIISCSVANVITVMLFSERYAPGDYEFQKLLSSNTVIMKGIELTAVFEKFVFLRYLPLDILKRFKEAISWRNELLSRKIEKHEITYDRSKVRDILDYIIACQKEKEAHEGEEYKPFPKDEIQMAISDIFLAGTDTSALSLQWGILYMTVHQEVQKKVQNELDHVLGDRMLATLGDKPLLPYTNATIHEILRKSSVSPLANPHVSRDSTSVNGYQIKAGSTFIFNLYAIHHDPQHWLDPDCFRPERFLDENGKFNSEHKSFMPFSLGVRACMGKKIAMVENFLFFANLLKCFEFHKCSEETFYDTEGEASAIIRPKPFKVRISKRV